MHPDVPDNQLGEFQRNSLPSVPKKSKFDCCCHNAKVSAIEAYTINIQ